MVDLVRKKPFGLAMLMAVLGFIGGLGSIAGSVIVATSLLGDGPYTMNGEVVPKAEFLGFLLPFMAFYLPAAVLAATAAWLIHSEDPRSRPVLLGYFGLAVLLGPLFLVLGLPLAEVASTAGTTLLFPIVAWFYLYRRRSVVEYYSAIALDREAFE